MIVLLLVHEALGNWNKAFRREIQIGRPRQAAQAVERGHPASSQSDGLHCQRGDRSSEERRSPGVRGTCLTMSCRLFHANLHFHHNQRFVLFLSANFQGTLIFLNGRRGGLKIYEKKLFTI
jgi:hypothetical protein